MNNVRDIQRQKLSVAGRHLHNEALSPQRCILEAVSLNEELLRDCKELPRYWCRSNGRCISCSADEIKLLQKIFGLGNGDFGKGRDTQGARSSSSTLKITRALRVENLPVWSMYEKTRSNMQLECVEAKL